MEMTASSVDSHAAGAQPRRHDDATKLFDSGASGKDCPSELPLLPPASSELHEELLNGYIDRLWAQRGTCRDYGLSATSTTNTMRALA